MRNVMHLKGNKLTAVLRHSWNMSNFLLSNQKCHNTYYFIRLLMRIPKWCLPSLYLLSCKSYCKKSTFVRFSDYCLNIPLQDPSFLISLNWDSYASICLHFFYLQHAPATSRFSFIAHWPLNVGLTCLWLCCSQCNSTFFEVSFTIEGAT